MGFGVVWRMRNVNEWHDFNANDWSTYPKVYSPIQVQYANGRKSDGDFLKLLSRVRLVREVPIARWRYINESSITQHPQSSQATLQPAKIINQARALP
jgi:hypothetical protein